MDIKTVGLVSLIGYVGYDLYKKKQTNEDTKEHYENNVIQNIKDKIDINPFIKNIQDEGVGFINKIYKSNPKKENVSVDFQSGDYVSVKSLGEGLYMGKCSNDNYVKLYKKPKNVLLKSVVQVNENLKLDEVSCMEVVISIKGLNIKSNDIGPLELVDTQTNEETLMIFKLSNGNYRIKNMSKYYFVCKNGKISTNDTYVSSSKMESQFSIAKLI
jgi:hypothetical protein